MILHKRMLFRCNDWGRHHFHYIEVRTPGRCVVQEEEEKHFARVCCRCGWQARGDQVVHYFMIALVIAAGALGFSILGACLKEKRAHRAFHFSPQMRQVYFSSSFQSAGSPAASRATTLAGLAHPSS